MAERCIRCGQKPYGCHCPPPPKPGTWIDRDGTAYDVIEHEFGGRTLVRRRDLPPRPTEAPTPHLIDIPPQWPAPGE